MPRDEPGCLNLVFLKKVEQSICPNSSAEDTTGDVNDISRLTCLSVDPAANGVDINTISNENFLDHDGDNCVKNQSSL